MEPGERIRRNLWRSTQRSSDGVGKAGQVGGDQGKLEHARLPGADVQGKEGVHAVGGLEGFVLSF